MLVYRPTKKDTWSDRCLFLSDEYIPTKEYNHRSILKNEIVIEYDYDEPNKNDRLTKKVETRLKEDNIQYSKWSSGNKSKHLHFFVDIGSVKNLPLLKKTIMRHYTEGIAVPDMRLATDNHLIRAENGVHEKTGRKKKMSYATPDYPSVNRITEDIWDRYTHNQKISISVRTNNYVSNLENHKAFQFILQSEKFRMAEDGKERAIFMMIHVLKNTMFKDNKEGMVKFLQEWYHYASNGPGNLSDQQIRHKVNWHWKKQYKVGINYLRELLESIGMEEILNE